MQGAMARLRSGRKQKPTITNQEGEEVEVITTGGKLVALEQKMGGGLPFGTVTLAVGAASSGKSVLCQHLTYGALEDGHSAAYFTSEQTANSLVTQMDAIGLDVSKYVRSGKLHVHTIPEPAESASAEPLLAQLAADIEATPKRCGARYLRCRRHTPVLGISAGDLRRRWSHRRHYGIQIH